MSTKLHPTIQKKLEEKLAARINEIADNFCSYLEENPDIEQKLDKGILSPESVMAGIAGGAVFDTVKEIIEGTFKNFNTPVIQLEISYGRESLVAQLIEQIEELSETEDEKKILMETALAELEDTTKLPNKVGYRYKLKSMGDGYFVGQAERIIKGKKNQEYYKNLVSVLEKVLEKFFTNKIEIDKTNAGSLKNGFSGHLAKNLVKTAVMDKVQINTHIDKIIRKVGMGESILMVWDGGETSEKAIIKELLRNEAAKTTQAIETESIEQRKKAILNKFK